MTVPIVDFGRFLNGSLQEREEAAAAVDAAFQNVGFVYLHNHGVPQERVDECFDWVHI
jgi:isopenicillin N synthase-like dioxygenase